MIHVFETMSSQRLPLSRRFLLALLAGAGLLAAQPPVTAELDRIASGYASQRHFMGAVLVAKDGKVLLEKAYGQANVEWSVPNVTDGRFRLGSITKQFTATAILQLVAEGKLSLDAPLCQFLDSCPEAWKGVRVHHLLNHTSGIPSYTGLPEFRTPRLRRLPLTPVAIAMLSKDKPLEFKPGEKMNYNNTGYVLLGHIIEKVSGQNYAEYLKTNIFDPLGMNATGYDETEQILEKRVAGYNWSSKGYRNATFLDMSLPHAAGSLYSTVGDLYKWDRALYGEKILSAAMKQKMFAPGLNDYAYGWSVTNKNNRQTISHGGGIFGFSTMIQRFPEQDAVVIVLSNVANVSAGNVANSLAGALFGEKVELPWDRKTISLSKDVLDRYKGRYKLRPFVLTVTEEDGRLMVQPANQPKLQAHAENERKFFLKEVDVTLEFTGDASRPASGVILRQGGQTIEGSRVVE